jgi:hypothetical protein
MYVQYIYIFFCCVVLELRPLASFGELKEFSNFIQLQQAQTMPQVEEEKLKYFNGLVLKLMDKLNLNENTSQESLESGFIEDNNSNSSINSQHLNQSSQTATTAANASDNLLTFRYRTWSESNPRINASLLSTDKKKPKSVETSDSLFAFDAEDPFGGAREDDGNVQPFNDDIESDLDENFQLELDKPVGHMSKQPVNNQFQINNSQKNDTSSRYSCSVPRSIPLFSHIKENSNATHASKQFSYIDEYTLNMNLNKSRKANNITLDDDANDNYNSDNLGQAFAELASSIVQKDGTELFGDRPSRRQQIAQISKTYSNYDN